MLDPANVPGAPDRAGSTSAENLERELAGAQGGRLWLRRFLVLVSLLAIVGGVVVWRWKTRPPPPARYVTGVVTRGDVVESVQSTGSVQPLTQVQVGAQISGRLAKVYVDFNSLVKKGELLAEIDPRLLGATVESNRAQQGSSRAQVTRAQASLAAAEIALARADGLRKENAASQAEVDQARGARDVAQAELLAAQAQLIQTEAQLNYSQTNYAYAKIVAPIDGIVVSRNIDPGQTVAASFQAPVLFVIAEDLRKMRVLADVDEADVGKLKEGMSGEASVDAFSGEIFRGAVKQVRYNPNTLQGVVTYSAVVDVENPDMKLRPGMTATVTVKTQEAHDRARLPNAALRFKPTPPLGPDGKPKPLPPEPPLAKGKGRIYLLTDATPGDEHIEARIVDVGFTDGINTVLLTDLAPDARVVIDETDASLSDKKGSKGPRIF